MYTYTTQKQVRAAFWQGFPQYKRQRGKTQNDYPAVVRTEFVDFVDMLQKDGHISPDLAERVTL